MNTTEPGKEELEAVKALMTDWAKAFESDSLESILACYAEDAVLWGTFSTDLRRTPQAISEYFEPYFALTGRKMIFGEQLIRIYGDIAVSTGGYKVSWKKENRIEEALARYSFTCIKRDGRWLIVDHHSSVLPR